MARTYNRQPLTVNTPSSSDIKNYFATQSNWKGVVTNKNFLAVDQESFEEADNVFVDDNYILRSRPALKRDSDLEGVEDIIYFDNDIVIIVRSENIIVTFADKSELVLDRPEDFRFVQTDKGILYFTVDKIQLIDKAGTITDSEIYVPKTKLVNLDGTEEKLESKNVFTDAEITVYLYLSSERNFNNESKLLGKRVKIKNGKDYELEFTFTKYFSQTIIKEFLSLSDNLILNYRIFDKTYKYSPIAISSANTFAFIDIDTCQIYYSSDGIIFNIVCSVPKEFIVTDGERVNIIQFARDNPALLYVTLVKDTETFSINVISVESDMPDGSLRYPILTKIHDADSFNRLENSISFFPVDYDRVYYLTRNIEYEELCPHLKEVNGKIEYYFHNYAGFVPINVVAEDKYIIVTLSDGLKNELKILSFTDDNRDVCEVKATFSIDIPNLNIKHVGNGVFRGYNELDNNVYFYTFSLDGTSAIKLYSGNLLGLNNNSVYMVTDGFKYYEFENSLSSSINFVDTLKFVDYYKHSDCCFISSNYSKYVYWIAKFSENNCKLYSNDINEIIELESYNEGHSNIIVPSHISELTNLFMSKDNILYISQITENEAVYFPEINKQTFASKITNLQPLSESEMGIFLSDEIHYCYLTEYGYAYRKSRLDLGCKDGNDIETSFDGKYTLFDTDRGFVALSYQDFVASTEQSAVFVSDVIQSIYEDFRKQGVKLTKYKNYLLLYNNQSLLLYDLRNGSWWPWSISQINKIVRHNDDVKFIVNNKLCNLDYSVDNYYDDIDSRRLVLWSLKSQKMHLNANNNYKHIINMTFSAIGETEINPLSVKLNAINYRHFVDDGKEENFDYKVQLIRTFVKRLNYAKVREFQYILSTDDENVIQSPLQLSAITIKYKIGGQVR